MSRSSAIVHTFAVFVAAFRTQAAPDWSYSTRSPEIALETTSRWISEVPSKIV